MGSRRGRNFGIAAACVAAHALVIGWVWVQAPRLVVPVPDWGPPEPIIPLIIMPHTPPAAAGSAARPSPIRLHRRPQRFAPEETPPVAPLVVPDTPKVATAPTGPPRLAPTATSRDPGAEGLSRALKSRLGCANVAALTRAEREACEDRFAAGAKDAPFAGLGIERGKADALAKAAAEKEAYVKYRNGTSHLGTIGTGRNSGAIERPGAPNLGMGVLGHDLGAATGNDRPDTTISR